MVDGYIARNSTDRMSIGDHDPCKGVFNVTIDLEETYKLYDFTTFVLSLQICAAKIAKNQTYRYTYIYKGVTQTAIKGQKTEKLTKQPAFFHVFLPFFHFYLRRNLNTLPLVSSISEEERKLTFSIPKKRWKSRWKNSG